MTENKTAPEVPHADLIDVEELREAWAYGSQAALDFKSVAEMRRMEFDRWLAALGDTVPREEYERVAHELRDSDATLERVGAERDALAHFRDQVRRWDEANAHYDADMEELRVTLSTAPAVSLALHDAEVWDEGVRAKSASSSIFDSDVFAQNPYREEAK